MNKQAWSQTKTNQVDYNQEFFARNRDAERQIEYGIEKQQTHIWRIKNESKVQ